MISFVHTLFWILPSVLISLMAGYFAGRSVEYRKESRSAKEDRETALKTLVKLLQSTEQLSTNVGSHNAQLENVGKTVGELDLNGELEEVQQAITGQIEAVMKANKRLEDDLICARYSLEEQAQELDRTRREARTDALSGVANRKSFNETLAYWISNFKRKDERFALVLMDIDHFKWINDTHGHQAGDHVVTKIGKVLRKQLRECDYVARYGGDEFAMLLKEESGFDTAKLAERIRVTIEQNNIKIGNSEESIAVTFSMGLAYVIPDDSSEKIISRSDQALYNSKNSGRNQLNCFEEENPPAQTEPSKPGEPKEAVSWNSWPGE